MAIDGQVLSSSSEHFAVSVMDDTDLLWGSCRAVSAQQLSLQMGKAPFVVLANLVTEMFPLWPL